MPASELTGEEIGSSSEQYRHECELRWCLSLPDLEQRREYAQKIEKRRGKAVADKFRKDGQKLFELRKSTKRPLEQSQ